MNSTPLIWSDALVLDHPQLDETHREFVELLNQLGELLAGSADPRPLYAQLLAHTEQHFAMEEGWMAATGFAPENCHSRQHAMVLEVMREVERHARELQDLGPMCQILPELQAWFPAHAEMMDASLVYHLGQVGYDSRSGTLRQPLAADTPAIQTCGSQGCA